MIKLTWKYVNCPIISVTLVTIRFKTRIQCHDQMKNSYFQLPSALLQAVNSASFQLCTVLRNVKGQRKSLSTPGLMCCPLLTHSFHRETAALGFDYCSPDFQLATVTHRGITNLQEVIGVHLIARGVHDARSQPDPFGGTGQTLQTQGRTPEKGLGFGTVCIHPSAANTRCVVPLEHVNA